MQAGLAGEQRGAGRRMHHGADRVQGMVERGDLVADEVSDQQRTEPASPLVVDSWSNGTPRCTTSARSSSAAANSGSHAFSPAAPESPNAAKKLPSPK